MRLQPQTVVAGALFSPVCRVWLIFCKGTYFLRYNASMALFFNEYTHFALVRKRVGAVPATVCHAIDLCAFHAAHPDGLFRAAIRAVSLAKTALLAMRKGLFCNLLNASLFARLAFAAAFNGHVFILALACKACPSRVGRWPPPILLCSTFHGKRGLGADCAFSVVVCCAKAVAVASVCHCGWARLSQAQPQVLVVVRYGALNVVNCAFCRI